MLVRAALVVVVTIVLGLCAVVSMVAFGATHPSQVPAVLERSWLWIYVVQAVLAGLAMYVTARVAARRVDGASLAAMVVAAYVVQLAVLMTGLMPHLGQRNAVAEWALLTGGPIQPVAAIIGALLGLRRQETPEPA